MTTTTTRPFSTFRERGITVGIVLVGVFLLAATGMLVAHLNRQSHVHVRVNTHLILAGGILQQAQNLRLGIQRMQRRGVSLSAITLDAAPGTGLYHPTDGTMERQRILTDAFYETSGNLPLRDWVWQRDAGGNPMVRLRELGTDAGADHVIMLGQLRFEVCNEINALLTDASNAIPAAAAGEGSWNDWTIRPSATLINLTANTAMDKPMQCIRTSDGFIIFYFTVEAN